MSETVSIHPLNDDVVKLFRSQSHISSFIDAICETLQNSIDAKADKIDITIDYSNLGFVTVDNGTGISPNDLKHVSQLHYTSKLDILNDTSQDILTYGFRGEALHSIANVSKMTIISKVSDYNSTWQRDNAGIVKLLDKMPSNLVSKYELTPFGLNESGTVVVTKSFFFNVAVRKQIEIQIPIFKKNDAIRNILFQYILYNPDLQISVCYLDQNCEKKLLYKSSYNCNYSFPKSDISIFRSIFGNFVESKMLKKVSVNFQDIGIKGIISKLPVNSKQYQFIFINGRKLISDEIFKKINLLFRSCNFGSSISDFNNNKETKISSKYYNRFPIIILKISCKNLFFDLLQTNLKNIIDPYNINILLPLLLKVISSFLKVQGYIETSKINEESSKSFSSTSLIRYPESNNISISYLMKSINEIDNQTENDKSCSNSLSRNNTRNNIPIFNNGFYSSTRYGVNKILKREHSINRTNEEKSGSLLKRPRLEDVKLPQTPKVLNSLINHDNTTGFPYTLFSLYSKPLEDSSVLKLNKKSFQHMKVINQIDKKFILVEMASSEHQKSHDLFILDQHASDERIKLELYLKDFMYDVLTESVDITVLDNFMFEIPYSLHDNFKYYIPEFQKWGIKYCIKSNNSDIDTNCVIQIYELPSILKGKSKKKSNFLKTVMLEHINELKSSKKTIFNKSAFQIFSDQKVQSLEWWKIQNTIPTFLKEFFNNKACRSAIMFGDKLSKDDCDLLLSKLSTCNMPFQCAHGRPSIQPLLSWRTDIIDNTDSLSKFPKKIVNRFDYLL